MSSKEELEKRRRRLRNLKINEVSFVDDPAVPTAKFVIMKRAGGVGAYQKTVETRTEIATETEQTDTQVSALTTSENSAETVIKTAVEILLKVSSAMPDEMVTMVQNLASMLGMNVEPSSDSTMEQPDVAKALHKVQTSLAGILPSLVEDAQKIVEPVIKAIHTNFPEDTAVVKTAKPSLTEALTALKDGIAQLEHAVTPESTGSDESSDSPHVSTKSEVDPIVESTADHADHEDVQELLALANQIVET